MRFNAPCSRMRSSAGDTSSSLSCFFFASAAPRTPETLQAAAVPSAAGAVRRRVRRSMSWLPCAVMRPPTRRKPSCKKNAGDILSAVSAGALLLLDLPRDRGDHAARRETDALGQDLVGQARNGDG